METQIIMLVYSLAALFLVSLLWLWTTDVRPAEWQTLLRAFVVTLFFSPALLLLADSTLLLPLLAVILLWMSGDIPQAVIVSSWVWFSILVSWSVWFAVLFIAKNPYARG